MLHKKTMFRLLFLSFTNLFAQAFDFTSLLTLRNKPHINHEHPMTHEHLETARLCQLVYDDEYLHNSERFVDSPSTDVQCAMSVKGSKLFVVFRGSDHETDWAHNFNANLVEYPKKSKSEFHAGFLVQWLSVRDEVKKKVHEMIELKEDIDTVIFAGHSAGSPPACLCAKELGLDSENYSLKIFTFGSPRFSNTVFKTDFETDFQCTRIVLDRDVITRFPLKFYNGYAHVGSPLQLREDHVIERESTYFEAIQWLLLGIPKLDLGIRDHDIGNYVEKIKHFLDKDKKVD